MADLAKKLCRFLRDKDYRFLVLDRHGFTKPLSDKAHIKKMFHARMGYYPDLKDPKTFSEKLQWLKLHDRNPAYCGMVDKYAAKKFVAGVIGEKYIIPTYAVWDRVEEIDFSALPEQFVLKCTHDCGSLIVCRDKSAFDAEAAKKKLRACLKKNYYWQSREWPYKHVKPRIIAEKFMSDDAEDGEAAAKSELTDYKFLCFNGVVKCLNVCTDRFSGDGLKVTYFDRAWNRLPFERYYPASQSPIEKPENFDVMIELAERLGRGIPLVRIDFYEIRGRVYFGEMTFFPGSGMEPFKPAEWDRILGDDLRLPGRATGGGV